MPKLSFPVVSQIKTYCNFRPFSSCSVCFHDPELICMHDGSTANPSSLSTTGKSDFLFLSGRFLSLSFAAKIFRLPTNLASFIRCDRPVCLSPVSDLLPAPVLGVSTSSQGLEEELSPTQCWRKCLYQSQRFGRLVYSLGSC